MADAIFRLQPERRLRPNGTHLAGAGHLNLLTQSGPLDLLAYICTNLGYEDLLPHSGSLCIAEGLFINVLNLEMLISVKEALGSEKDKAVLPILCQTLEELARKKQ